MVLSTLEQIQQLAIKGELLGVFDISDELYHHPECPGVSRSRLEKARGTPEQFAHDMAQFWEPSKNMLIGLGLHALMLQPEVFKQRYFWTDLRKGTKNYKAFISENKLEKHHMFTAAEWRDIGGMASKIKSRPELMAVLSGYYEKAFFWIEKVRETFVDPATGEENIQLVDVLCKCKPDSTSFKHGYLTDLKTTKDADSGSQGFIKSVFEFGYHIQNAFYMDGVKKAVEQGGKSDLDFVIPKYFIFLAIEAKAPYAHGRYQLPGEFVDEGRQEYRWLLRRYNQYIKTKKHEMIASYTHGKILILKPKAYMFRQRSDENEGEHENN